ncbi:MAG: ATP synthase F1 subunit epsilon [Oscillospiraceae bacterium]|jgi:F-type H+-transporting ATPase subunit epsilon|nr:ATP synthase F1 subunit epsilon [Oscillospiraceae bacterium]
MATFRLQIITPERVFLDEQAEMITVEAPDGQIGICAGHAPMLITTRESAISIKRDGQWKVAAASDGTLTVTPDHVLLMLQTIEWPEEIDTNRAHRDEERAREALRQKGSMQEYLLARAMLSRAMVRLRVHDQANEGE